LVASYDLRPGNGAGLFSKSKASNEVHKKGNINKEKRKKVGEAN